MSKISRWDAKKESERYAAECGPVTVTRLKSTTETFQGVPCKRGHPGVRLVSNRKCIDCAALHRKGLLPPEPRQPKPAVPVPGICETCGGKIPEWSRYPRERWCSGKCFRVHFLARNPDYVFITREGRKLANPVTGKMTDGSYG